MWHCSRYTKLFADLEEKEEKEKKEKKKNVYRIYVLRKTPAVKSLVISPQLPFVNSNTEYNHVLTRGSQVYGFCNSLGLRRIKDGRS